MMMDSMTRHGDLDLEQLATLKLLGFLDLMPQLLTVKQQQERTPVGNGNSLTTRQQFDDSSVGFAAWAHNHSGRKQSSRQRQQTCGPSSAWQQPLGPSSARQQKLDPDSTTRQQTRSLTLDPAAIGGLAEEEEDNLLVPRAVPLARSIALPRSQMRFALVDRIELWQLALSLWCGVGNSKGNSSSSNQVTGRRRITLYLLIHTSNGFATHSDLCCERRRRPRMT